MADQLAPDADIQQLVASLEDPETNDLETLDAILLRFPDDPRLHFMRGSVLIGEAEHIKAHAALSRAVELAPEYNLARYQLGFFELTSGEADKALSTWGPLLKAPKDNFLRVFVEGMVHLIRDEFPEAIAAFERGISLNNENPPMNSDIQLLISELRVKMDEKPRSPDDGSDDDPGATSAASLLLGQLGGNRTTH